MNNVFNLANIFSLCSISSCFFNSFVRPDKKLNIGSAEIDPPVVPSVLASALRLFEARSLQYDRAESDIQEDDLLGSVEDGSG